MSPLLTSLLHSLWIGLVLWLVLRVTLRGGRLSTEARHGLAVGATVLLFTGWGMAWMMASAGAGGTTMVATVVVPPESVLVVNQAVSVAAPAEAPIMALARERSAGVGERLRRLDRMVMVQWCLEWAWALGVCFGLARLVHGLRAGGTRWLGSQTVGELPAVWLSAWQGRLEVIAARLKARLVAIEAAGAPMVVGLLEPVIVVPLASCAGITPEMARVALAHELAHVARRDWLVEIGLRVVEAVLFFNPFVWLLTARVREEREACCDAWACERLQCSGEAVAESLAAWARRLTESEPAATGALGLEGGLLRRVERLLGGVSAGRALTWRGTVGVLALILCGLAAYGVALRWGARSLSDAERVALLDDVAAPHVAANPWVPQPVSEVRPERIVSGRVVDERGRPVAEARISIWTGDHRTSGSVKTDVDGNFAARRAFAGPAELRVQADGVAMRRAYVNADEAELADAIIMPDGLSVPVRVLDEAGGPVAGARVDWNLDVFAPRDADQAVSDRDGRVVIPHLPMDIPVYVRAEADGYAAVGIGPLTSDQLAGRTPAEIRMIPGRSVTLRVVADDGGNPVAKARVRVESLQPRWSPGVYPHPSWNYRGLSTDAEGSVVLNHLRPDTSYRLRVEAPMLTDVELPLVNAPAVEQEVRLRKGGKITVKLKNLPEEFRSDSMTLWLEQGGGRWAAPLRPQSDGTTSVVLSLRDAGPVTLRFADERWAAWTVRAKSVAELGEVVEFDFSQPPADAVEVKRHRVAIRFMDGSREVFPSGRFFIHRKATERSWDGDAFALEPGKALHAEWPAGTRLRLTDASQMIGAKVSPDAIDEQREFVVDERLTEIVVPVTPAGLVRAQVRSADGELLRSAGISGANETDNESRKRYIVFTGNQSMGEWQISGPVEFSFWRTPIWAAEGLVFARGPAVKVSERQPVVDVVVTLPKTRTYRVYITDDEGKPLPAVVCTITARFDSDMHRSVPFGHLQRTSAGDGAVTFEAGVDFPQWDGLRLLVEASRSGYARVNREFAARDLSGRPVIVMPPAAIFRARIVDPNTSAGVAGISINYSYTKIPNGSYARHGTGPVSDVDGWFTFTDLMPDQPFVFSYSVPNALGSLWLEPEKKGDLTAADSGVTIYTKPVPR